ASSNSRVVIPRVFQNDTPEDKKAVQSVIGGVMMYPVSEFDGSLKTHDWTKVQATPPMASGSEEGKWGPTDKMIDTLPPDLDDARSVPGEEARYAQVLAVLGAAKSNPAMKDAMTKAVEEVDRSIISPLFEFRNFGLQLPHYWSSITNGAAFGTDYFTRTATGK